MSDTLWAWLGVLVSLAASAQTSPPAPKPGALFQSADLQALAADDFANPGLLWVERGAKLWREPAGVRSKSCQDCHGEASQSMRGVAARYPGHDVKTGRVLNLEGRINACVVTHQQAPALAYESEALLSLSALLARQALGTPISVATTGPARATYARGAALYNQRIGQINLACTHCHDKNWGKTLLAEPISQGQPDGWPAYRIEWQSLGSLQRRLRACFFGVRAEQPAYGSEDLVALELYLAKRAHGLRMAAPGVRR